MFTIGWVLYKKFSSKTINVAALFVKKNMWNNVCIPNVVCQLANKVFLNWIELFFMHTLMHSYWKNLIIKFKIKNVFSVEKVLLCFLSADWAARGKNSLFVSFGISQHLNNIPRIRHTHKNEKPILLTKKSGEREGFRYEEG